MDEALDPLEDNGDEDELFDEHLYRGTSHTEYDERLISSAQKASDDVKRFVVHEFINEAVVAATNLRNLLGDADGHAYDLAETIRANMMIVLQQINKDPGEFVLAFLRAEEDKPTLIAKARSITDKVNTFISVQQ